MKKDEIIIDFLENKKMNKEIAELENILKTPNYITKEKLLNKFYNEQSESGLEYIQPNNITEGIFINPFSNRKVSIVFDDNNTQARHYQLSIHRNLEKDIIFYSENSFKESLNYFSKHYHLDFLNNGNQKEELFRHFVISHELAHLSLLQKSFAIHYEDDTERKLYSEIHSDLCGIIKTIKDYNLDTEQSLGLCNSLVTWRNGKYNLLEVFLANEESSLPISHPTELFLIHFKEFLKDEYNLTKLKKLTDINITAFSNILVDNYNSLNNNLIIENFFGTNNPTIDEIKNKLHSIDDWKFEKAVSINMEVLNREGYNLSNKSYFFDVVANKASVNKQILHSISFKSALLIEGKEVKEYLDSLVVPSVFNNCLKELDIMTQSDNLKKKQKIKF